MPVPAPPDPLPRPNLLVLPEGSRLHRIHDRRFGGAAFNPGFGAPTRFAPLRRADGFVVPTLYAGSTLEAAAFETLFHDIPPAAPIKTVPRSLVASRAHSVLVARRPLRLAELRAPDLHRWGLPREALVAAPPTDYAATALWALAAHEAFADLDGLVWTSNRCDPADALTLWGTRAADAIAVAERREGNSPDLLAEVRAAAARAGIVLTI